MQHGKINVLNDNCLSVVSKLIHLILKFNKISHIFPRAFQGIYSTESIDLKGNSITTLPKLLFAHLCRLKYLDISGNSVLVVYTNIFKRSSSGTIVVKSSCCVFCCFEKNVKCKTESNCLLACNTSFV